MPSAQHTTARYIGQHTPVEQRGPYLCKRDDLYGLRGQNGGKLRACMWLVPPLTRGVTTACARTSPQAAIVAAVAQDRGVPCVVHVPWAPQQPPTPQQLAATRLGAYMIPHRPGRNSVIVARAREYAAEHGYFEVPFGMECAEAVTATAHQAENLPWGRFKRIVVTVGSGMSLCGILHGLERAGQAHVPVVGVIVGADPGKRLQRWAPPAMLERVTLVRSALRYEHRAPVQHLHGMGLDAVYEAKVLPYLEPGDLLWVVGVRPGN